MTAQRKNATPRGGGGVGTHASCTGIDEIGSLILMGADSRFMQDVPQYPNIKMGEEFTDTRKRRRG